MRFTDRAGAGQALAAELMRRDLPGDVIVLGLPRGGVVVAAEVARVLGCPLDAWAVRKVGVPWQPELALGAVASGGQVAVQEDVVRAVGLSTDLLEQLVARAQSELTDAEKRWRPMGRQPLAVSGRPVVIVDDGFATGATAQAAVLAARAAGCSLVVLAAPVGPRDTVKRLQTYADQVVVCHAPRDFENVGRWYRSFGQTTDAEVRALLNDR